MSGPAPSSYMFRINCHQSHLHPSSSPPEDYLIFRCSTLAFSVFSVFALIACVFTKNLSVGAETGSEHCEVTGYLDKPVFVPIRDPVLLLN